MDIMPNTGIKIANAPLVMARSCSTGGKALCFLLKKYYSQERMATSTMAKKSKEGYTTLPPDEMDAIKGTKI